MELTWIDAQHPVERDLAAMLALREASRLVDAPHRLGGTVSSVVAYLRSGWDGDPPVLALARDERARPIGLVSVSLSHWDNTHAGSVVVTVDPALRRRGLGRELFEVGLARVREDVRRVVMGHGYDSPAVAGFATAMGMEQVCRVAHRRQDLRTADWARLEREYAAAHARAKDYDLVRVAGATPEELMPAVVTMTAAINDAPLDGLDLEDEVFSPERIRAYEDATLARGERLYRLVARHRDSGELAGHTVVAVDRERPWWGDQHDTSVVQAHRGHRLGVLLKIGMLHWLAEEEPQLHTVDTTNAASNSHMIRVNELIGYRLVATSSEWQRHL